MAITVFAINEIQSKKIKTSPLINLIERKNIIRIQYKAPCGPCTFYGIIKTKQNKNKTKQMFTTALHKK